MRTDRGGQNTKECKLVSVFVLLFISNCKQRLFVHISSADYIRTSSFR